MSLSLTEADVTRLLAMTDALDAVERVFRLHGQGDAINIARSRVRLPGSTLHVMSGGSAGLNLFGLKTYTTTRQGARFVVLLFQADTGALLAMMEADRLGQMRTGAVSGVATKYMARQEAQTVGLIGTGWQARSQLAAVCGVRRIARINAFSRDATRCVAFCNELSDTLGVPVLPALSAEQAVRDADVVITVTNAREPVLLGQWLKPGAHVNAAGSNALIRCEIDEETVRRANLVVVDSKEQAKIECGDLLGPIECGLIHWDQVRELGEIVAGRLPARQTPEEITLFESQGLAIEDIAVAAVVYERALGQGVGREL